MLGENAMLFVSVMSFNAYDCYVARALSCQLILKHLCVLCRLYPANPIISRPSLIHQIA